MSSKLISIGICAIGISLLHAFGTENFITRIASLCNKTRTGENRPVAKPKLRKTRTSKKKLRTAGKNKGDIALSRIISTSLNKQLDDAISRVLGTPEKHKKQNKPKDKAVSLKQIDHQSENMWSTVNHIRKIRQRQTEYSYGDIRNAFEIRQQNTKAAGVRPVISHLADRQEHKYIGTISCLQQEVENLRTDQSKLWFLHSIA